MKNLFLNPKNIIFLGVLFLTIGLAFASSYNVRTPDNLPKIEKEKTLFILDFSNSMNETLRGRKKITIMLETMAKILPTISPLQEIGLRVYGHRLGFTTFDACRASKLSVPIGSNNANAITEELSKTKPNGMTPITYSLKKAVTEDFKGFDGQKHIILLTDGEENCNESPCLYAMKLIRNDKNVKIDVIAFAVDNAEAIEQLECVAFVTRGNFHTANTATELVNSVNRSLNIQKEVEAQIMPNY